MERHPSLRILVNKNDLRYEITVKIFSSMKNYFITYCLLYFVWTNLKTVEIFCNFNRNNYLVEKLDSVIVTRYSNLNLKHQVVVHT